ncbi:MAG: UvrB/uvrC motif, partial [Chloroflexota bacterium]|nr:UvrB/uvrC motif [Chloroflexota bacterium]
NERLRAVAESTVVYASERTGEFSEADRAKVEALVARMEAEMKAAAKQLEFERAAALRDEIQQIRLRVLQEDASISVGRAAERAAGSSGGRGLTGAADRARGRRGAAAAVASGPAMEVTSVTVLGADEEPGDNLDGVPGEGAIDEGTVADWLPGIRDEHEDDAGWQARWLDRPTWDRTVTPNIRKRTGQRPARRR